MKNTMKPAVDSTKPTVDQKKSLLRRTRNVGRRHGSARGGGAKADRSRARGEEGRDEELLLRSLMPGTLENRA